MNISIQAIEEAVREAGSMLLEANRETTAIHQKQGIANFCTDSDMEIQRFLIERLSEILPGAAIFGEEDTEGNTGADAQAAYTFYIDPIDGTTNFMFGYHHSGVSVGLAQGRKMIAGFVYNPYVDEMYRAVCGEGSFLNGRRLTITDRSIAEGIVAFGCARYNEGDTDLLFATVKEAYLKSLSVRNGGSAALDLCRTASASNAVYLELKLQPYDYAAASVIIEEAGGCITQADGAPITFHRPCSIVAGTPKACREVRQMIKEQMKEKFMDVKELSETAYRFLNEFRPEEYEDGRHEVADGVYVLLQSYTTKYRRDARFEAHRNYIDVQYIISGREIITTAPVLEMTDEHVTQPYVPGRDIVYYDNTPVGVDQVLEEGQYGIYKPEDAHMPCVCIGQPAPVRKLVIKIPVK